MAFDNIRTLSSALEKSS